MRGRTKRVKISHSPPQLTRLPVTSGKASSIQPFPGDFPTEVWLEVHPCSCSGFPSANQPNRFWRGSNYGICSRCIGPRKPCRHCSNGECVSIYGRMPYDAFTTSTYLVSQDPRVGTWPYSSYIHPARYALLHLIQNVYDQCVAYRCADSKMRHGNVSDGKSACAFVDPVPTKTRCKRRVTS